MTMKSYNQDIYFMLPIYHSGGGKQLLPRTNRFSEKRVDSTGRDFLGFEDDEKRVCNMVWCNKKGRLEAGLVR